jgi:hypothetical protein
MPFFPKISKALQEVYEVAAQTDRQEDEEGASQDVQGDHLRYLDNLRQCFHSW